MLLDEIGAYLVSQGLVTDPGSLFKGVIPDSQDGKTPDDVVCLIQLPGRPSAYTMGKTVAEYPRLKVVVRNLDSLTAETTAHQIMTTLETVANQVLSGATYLRIQTLRPPYQSSPIRDRKLRWYWAVEFDIWRVPS